MLTDLTKLTKKLFGSRIPMRVVDKEMIMKICRSK